MIQLYEHARRIVEEDKPRTGIFLGTGSTKTRISLCLARGRTLVVCPKITRDDRTWPKEVEKIREFEPGFSVDLTVVSKEEFRRDHERYERFDTLIADEAHKMLGVERDVKRVNKVSVPKTSKFYDSLAHFVRRTDPERLYLVTASMMSNPLRVWAAARLYGYDWDFFEFRQTFYTSFRMPGKYFDVWNIRKGEAIKERLAKALNRIGYVGRLEDWNDVPPQVFRDVYVELTAEQRRRIREIHTEYPDPGVRMQKIHQVENGLLIGNEFKKDETFWTEKTERIEEYADEFGRIVVFAKFTQQIETLRKDLAKKGRTVFVLNGQTRQKDREDLLDRVRQAKECVFIVQAQISYGWELPDFPCMVFASRTYVFDDYDQALGRIQRANNIKRNVYVNLMARPETERAGGQTIVINDSDQAVHECVSEKKDFSEAQYKYRYEKKRS